ncbi:MAG: DUF4129 domain-containing protein, partial [Bacteroidota bacterium]
LLLLCLGAILLLMLLRYYFSVPKNQKVTTTSNAMSADLATIANNLEAHNPRILLQEAIDTENYRLAVRLYYLEIIRELSLKKQIEWKHDKTNRIYLHEMRGHLLEQPFREITQLFEKIWYGNRRVPFHDFEAIRAKAEFILLKIKLL